MQNPGDAGRVLSLVESQLAHSVSIVQVLHEKWHLAQSAVPLSKYLSGQLQTPKAKLRRELRGQSVQVVAEP